MTFPTWADDEAGLDELLEKLRGGIRAEWTTATVVPGIIPDAAVTADVAEAIRSNGPGLRRRPSASPLRHRLRRRDAPGPKRTHRCCACRRLGLPHTAGEEDFASEDGVIAALAMAEVLALTALRVLGPT